MYIYSVCVCVCVCVCESIYIERNFKELSHTVVEVDKNKICSKDRKAVDLG